MEEDNKKIVQRELAQSVREKGSVRCPSCTSLIEWEDSVQYNPDGSKDRYFWCSNVECELHRRDVVKVSISQGFLQTFQQNFSKIGQGAIAALFGAISVWGYGHLNPGDGGKEEIAKIQNERKEEQKKNAAEKDSMTKQLTDLKAEMDRIANGETPTRPINNAAKIDSLQKIIADKNNEIGALTKNSGAGKSQLSPREMADLGVFYASGKNKKSKKAKKYLFQVLKNPNAGFDDEEYQKIVSSLIGLRTSLTLEEFEPLLKEIENHMPNNMQDVEQAKVYWYYADKADFSKYRKLKLTSLKCYLQGAGRYTISQQDVNDGLKLIEMYQLGNIDPENFQSSTDIATAFSNQNKSTIRKFLEYGTKPKANLW